VLSGRALCDGLITRPEESYRLWRVVVCDLENLVNEVARAHWVGGGLSRQIKKTVVVKLLLLLLLLLLVLVLVVVVVVVVVYSYLRL